LINKLFIKTILHLKIKLAKLNYNDPWEDKSKCTRNLIQTLPYQFSNLALTLLALTLLGSLTLLPPYPDTSID